MTAKPRSPPRHHRNSAPASANEFATSLLSNISTAKITVGRLGKAGNRFAAYSAVAADRMGAMLMKLSLIPRHEPEVVQAAATKRHFGNDERVPTTFFKSMMLRGVKIESRFRKADEFESMLRIIPNFTDRQCRTIEFDILRQQSRRRF